MEECIGTDRIRGSLKCTNITTYYIPNMGISTSIHCGVCIRNQFNKLQLVYFKLAPAISVYHYFSLSSSWTTFSAVGKPVVCRLPLPCNILFTGTWAHITQLSYFLFHLFTFASCVLLVDIISIIISSSSGTSFSKFPRQQTWLRVLDSLLVAIPSTLIAESIIILRI